MGIEKSLLIKLLLKCWFDEICSGFVFGRIRNRLRHTRSNLFMIFHFNIMHIRPGYEQKEQDFHVKLRYSNSEMIHRLCVFVQGCKKQKWFYFIFYMAIFSTSTIVPITHNGIPNTKKKQQLWLWYRHCQSKLIFLAVLSVFRCTIHGDIRNRF